MVFILLLCISSSGISALSSSSNGTYTPPICDPDGFYCPRSRYMYVCFSRTQRCTGDDGLDSCIQKTYQHCDYDGDGKFRVYRHATRLPSSILTSSRHDFGIYIPNLGNPLACLFRKPEHHFITYRGLMYEFGIYGNRVQDPNDPHYEYNNTRQESGSPAYLGTSNCTYQEVIEFMRIWTDYKLCSRNCQDFAKGLGEYLINYYQLCPCKATEATIRWRPS